MTRASLTFFFATIAALLVIAPASTVDAQEEEARLLFERGNQHLAGGMRARGARRTRELQQALDAYLGVLRLGARTRNVVFNLALTLQELGREAEAFNYYSQYLREFDLGDADRAAGQERMETLRTRVAVATVTSTPPGAEVRVDRRDLPVRGTTPLELALSPGDHTLFFSLNGFEDGSSESTFTVGQAQAVGVELVGRPVSVQFIAPSGGRLTLDGNEISAGHAVPVPPGNHVVRLELPNVAPLERRFELQPGSDPMTISLAGGSGTANARVALSLNVEGQAYLDGLPMGRGQRIAFPALPGEHVLRVEADGHNTLEHNFSLSLEQSLALEISMGEQNSSGGLNAGRWISFSAAVVALASASITTGAAFDLSDQYNDRLMNLNDGRQEQALLSLADDVESMALIADVLWGVTALAGGVTILLFAISPGENVDSTVQVTLAPTPGGGALTARGSF